MNLDKLTNNVIQETDEMIKTFGPRLAGTKASTDTANHLYEKAKIFSDDAKIEDFYINKGAFLGWINILVIFYVLGLISFILNYPVITAVLSLLSIIILYLQFIKYLPIIDFLFPKKKARNVYGVINPKGEVKQTIIVSGHHDSAPVFNFFIHQPKLYGLRVTGSILFVVMALFIGLLNIFIKNNIFFYISLGVLALGSLLVIQMWFFKSRKATPGAGDNLASTNIAFEIGKYFYNLKGSDKELNNTKIIFASFDAEEEGLRGARAFVKKHKTALEAVPTYLLNIECLYDKEALFFLTSDINDTVKLSDELASDLVETASSLGIKTHKQDIVVLTGGTDAGEFGKINVEATTIVGMPWNNENRGLAYHTPDDTIDAVSKEAVSDTLNIFINYIKDKDLK